MENRLTTTDISVLKYYKEGMELCGFEGVHDNLRSLGYLDGDLELTNKARDFIKTFDFSGTASFDNKMYISIR